MFRIDTPGSIGGFFTLGDPSTGIKATQLGADWPNEVQEEIARLIEGQGITLQKGNRDQLAQAIGLASGGGVKGTKKNLLANSTLRIWQRGLTRPIANGVPVYTADRWKGDAGAGGTASASRQQHAVGAAPDPRSGNDYLQWIQSVAATVSPILEQRTPYLEQTDAQDLVFSVYLRVTTGTGAVTPRLRQLFGAGGSATTDVTGAAWTVTTTWTRFSVKLTPPSIVGKTIGTNAYLSAQLLLPTGGTFTLEMACPQLEVGSIATFFELPAPTEELLECWRYFWKSYDLDTTPGTIDVYNGCLISSEDIGAGVQQIIARFPVEMRTIPTITWYSPNSSNAFGKIEYGPGNDNPVTKTDFTSARSTGFPTCLDPGGPVREAFAQVTANAEF
jgi:hypothetical protein